ncbi:hypothetical protein BKP45_04900 [Anaerobacillus alkalidiazotrophicus]|uniref:RNA methyltransferase n=1 Tax=Anaerobacillus alkalidiazotrophicus TaxID=472963 RepID=A0A1S2MB80_9BACI|nr:hypothetical protein [Anaerobacillus alkalidiazotrophicus]OIJ22018.1 hypothetical protein BKP45_04900 [Anaerobacillus alkalidiazotrophicus]
MATYVQIQQYVKHKYGYIPKTCWIAHMKEVCGLKPKTSHNRHSSNNRINPCPSNKEEHIKDAFKHFKMI